MAPRFTTMDNIKVGRNKKSDKTKEKFERNGKFSPQHVRMMEAMAEKRAGSAKPSKPASN